MLVDIPQKESYVNKETKKSQKQKPVSLTFQTQNIADVSNPRPTTIIHKAKHDKNPNFFRVPKHSPIDFTLVHIYFRQYYPT